MHGSQNFAPKKKKESNSCPENHQFFAISFMRPEKLLLRFLITRTRRFFYSEEFSFFQVPITGSSRSLELFLLKR
jgi:hypothetical protein